MKNYKILTYYINLDERGEFFADIRDEDENTIFEIDTEYAIFLTEEKINVRNVTQLLFYLRSMGHIPENTIVLKRGN